MIRITSFAFESCKNNTAQLQSRIRKVKRFLTLLIDLILLIVYVSWPNMTAVLVAWV